MHRECPLAVHVLKETESGMEGERERERERERESERERERERERKRVGRRKNKFLYQNINSRLQSKDLPYQVLHPSAAV